MMSCKTKSESRTFVSVSIGVITATLSLQLCNVVFNKLKLIVRLLHTELRKKDSREGRGSAISKERTKK